MVTIKIKLRTDKTKQNEMPIVVQIIYKRKRRRIHTGKSIAEEKWDQNKDLPKVHYKHYKLLKSYLQELQSKCEETVLKLEKKHEYLTIDIISDTLKNQIRGGNDENYFYKYYEVKLQEYKDKGSFKTSSVSRGAFNKLKKFQSKDFPIEQLNYNFINDFDTYMKKTGCGINTISIYMRAIRSIYNKAIKEGIVDSNLYPFKNYTVKSETTQKRHLTKSEILKIKNVNLEHIPVVELMRDLFMFGIYARGMNYIDICKLKVKDVITIKLTDEKDEEIIERRINYTRSKTKSKFSIKVSNDMWCVIKKHGNLVGTKEDFLFPIFKKDSDYKYYDDRLRKFNRKLRIVQKTAKIDHAFTSYYMRHSYAMLAKNGGLSISLIKDSMGHSDVSITETYLASFSNEILDDANEKILNSLE